MFVPSKILHKNYFSHIDCSLWHASRSGMQPIVQPICNYVRDTDMRIGAFCGHRVSVGLNEFSWKWFTVAVG